MVHKEAKNITNDLFKNGTKLKLIYRLIFISSFKKTHLIYVDNIFDIKILNGNKPK